MTKLIQRIPILIAVASRLQAHATPATFAREITLGAYPPGSSRISLEFCEDRVGH
jgi:hypothetical protein